MAGKKERRELMRLGLLEAPKPKLKFNSLIRVLGVQEQAVKDLTCVEHIFPSPYFVCFRGLFSWFVFMVCFRGLFSWFVFMVCFHGLLFLKHGLSHPNTY